MVSSSNQLGVVLSAKDQISAVLQRVERHTNNLDKAFGSLGARVKTGIQWHIINNGLNMLDRVFRRIWNFLPDLIGRGADLASTINDITDATGMSARQASELVAVQRVVGGSTDGLGKAFKALSKSVTEHTEDWKAYGVRIARSKDGNVDAYRTFRNLQAAVAASGAGTLSFAAAQKLAGKGAGDLLDLLQLTPRQYREIARDAARSGQIMSDAQNAAAEAFERSRNTIQGTIDGIGSQIYQGLLPSLTAFVKGFDRFLKDNMDRIVTWVVGAGNAVLNVIGGLLGVDMGSFTVVDAIERSGKGAERVGPKLRQHARDHQEAARSSREHASATDGLAAAQKRLREAQRELRQARGGATFGANLSEADRILAEQARQAAIKRARQGVADAHKALLEHRQTMRSMAEASEASARRGAAAYRKAMGPGGVVPTSVIEGMDQMLEDSKAFGLHIADVIKDAIFGEDKRQMVAGGLVIETRAGGLLDKLKTVGDFLASVGGHLHNLNGLLGGNGPLVLGIAALVKLLPGGEALLGAILGRTFRRGPGRESPKPAPSKAPSGVVPWGFWLSLATGVQGDTPMLPRRPDQTSSNDTFPNAGWFHNLRQFFMPDRKPPQPSQVFPWLTPGAGAMGPYLPFSNPPRPGGIDIPRWLYPMAGRPGGVFGHITPPNPRQNLADPWISNPVGFGVNNPWSLALRGIGDTGRALQVGGDAYQMLQNIETAIIGVEEGIRAGGTGGGTGGGTALANLTARVEEVERINGNQAQRIAEALTDAGAAQSDANAAQSDATRANNRITSLTRPGGIIPRLVSDKVGVRTFNEFKKGANQRDAKHLSDLTLHALNINRLNRAHGIPNMKTTSTSAQAPTRPAVAGSMSIRLDARETRRLLSGRQVNTSLKPA